MYSMQVSRAGTNWQLISHTSASCGNASCLSWQPAVQPSSPLMLVGTSAGAQVQHLPYSIRQASAAGHAGILRCTYDSSASCSLWLAQCMRDGTALDVCYAASWRGRMCHAGELQLKLALLCLAARSGGMMHHGEAGPLRPLYKQMAQSAACTGLQTWVSPRTW